MASCRRSVLSTKGVRRGATDGNERHLGPVVDVVRQADACQRRSCTPFGFLTYDAGIEKRQLDLHLTVSVVWLEGEPSSFQGEWTHACR